MSARTLILFLALTLPLSGCATTGLLDRVGKALDEDMQARAVAEALAKGQQPASTGSTPKGKAEPSPAEQQAAAKARQEEWDLRSAQSFLDWLKQNERYIRELCASPAGSALHIDAFDNLKFAVSSDEARFAEAKLRGGSHDYRVASCPREGQSVQDANPLSDIVAEMKRDRAWDQPAREAHPQLKRFEEERRKREEQERTDRHRAEEKRAEDERIERIVKRIDRGLAIFFDVAMFLFLYGSFNDGEFF